MSTKDEKILGPEFRKIHPKLRMFAKARDDVNGVRAEYASAMSCAGPHSLSEPVQTRKVEVVKSRRGLKTPDMQQASVTAQVSTFITRFPDKTNLAGIGSDQPIEARTMLLSELADIARLPDIAYIEPGEALKAPEVTVSSQIPAKPKSTTRNIPGRDLGGKNVLIGIIDVGGFDFSHPDFLDADGGTRFLRIWDQSRKFREPPRGFKYGSEITKQHMDAALAAAPAAGVPAWALEPQSQMTPGSHATHVASIAAGNLGVSRNAFLAGVLIDIPRLEDTAEQRRLSFYDSVRVAEAASYLFDLAEELRQELGLEEPIPVSLNVSLGTNGGGHDASSGVSRWIDHELAVPGRSLCVASGNAGQEAATSPDDHGFITGRIHTSGKVPARGLTQDLEWVVVGNGIADISENELEIWYSGADRLAVSLTPPGMATIGPISTQQYMQNEMLPDGSMVSIYNELYHPANGANCISIYLSPFLREDAPVVGVRPGLWRVRLHGDEIRDGSYHGWIERDDPRRRGVVGQREFWNFPSFFTTTSNVDNSSVSSLACGARVVSVANLNEASGTINISSSQGPTRDGRFKPDVAAPGTEIVAANGFAGEEDGDWVAMTGTSMASPYVAGVIGLMLEAQPRLTAAQIVGIIQRTSDPLPGRPFSWSDDSGFGVLDAHECVAEARNLTNRVKVEL